MSWQPAHTPPFQGHFPLEASPLSLPPSLHPTPSLSAGGWGRGSSGSGSPHRGPTSLGGLSQAPLHFVDPPLTGPSHPSFHSLGLTIMSNLRPAAGPGYSTLTARGAPTTGPPCPPPNQNDYVHKGSTIWKCIQCKI